MPHALLRKYIAYARTHVHPVLSSEAKQVGPIPSAILFRPKCIVARAGQARHMDETGLLFGGLAVLPDTISSMVLHVIK